MDRGQPESPFRVAVIGSGPTGFYASQHLLDQESPVFEVDLYDRLPTPFGLVRFGVAPDHQKIKSVIKIYSKTAKHERFSFFGGIDVGNDVSIEDLRKHYDFLIFCTGAQTDRKIGIPGEDLEGSHTATEFVAWYNGHPDFIQRKFDLSAETVVIVGVGNVAVDVARILCRSPEELRKTDIADHALRALEQSKVRQVIMLGRRGPAQAAFTNAELKELGELPMACTTIPKAETEPDRWTVEMLEKVPDKMLTRKLDLIQSFADRVEPEKPKQLEIRFLVSPKEILGQNGKVSGVLLERNELQATDDGYLAAKGTGKIENIRVGLVFRSVGYRGVPLPKLPFDVKRAIIPNQLGRVLDGVDGSPIPGIYCAGWIKRGPRGVIGTNKPDALETVKSILADIESGNLDCAAPESREARHTWIQENFPKHFSWQDWELLDARELADGEAAGRPRVKLVSREKMLKVRESKANT